MKVKCVKLLNDRNEEIKSSAWIALGRIYHVMSIIITENRGISYQIIDDSKKYDSIPMAYFSSKCFEIVSDIIPSNWSIEILKMRSIDISPKSWQTPEFLEDLYDGDSEAYKVFKYERDLIVREDP